MRREQSYELIARLQQNFWRYELPDETVHLWASLITRFEYEDASAGVDRIIEMFETMPSSFSMLRTVCLAAQRDRETIERTLISRDENSEGVEMPKEVKEQIDRLQRGMIPESNERSRQ